MCLPLFLAEYYIVVVHSIRKKRHYCSWRLGLAQSLCRRAFVSGLTPLLRRESRGQGTNFNRLLIISKHKLVKQQLLQLLQILKFQLRACHTVRTLQERHFSWFRTHTHQPCHICLSLSLDICDVCTNVTTFALAFKYYVVGSTFFAAFRKPPLRELNTKSPQIYQRVRT